MALVPLSALEVGIFARTFGRDDLDGTLTTATDMGFQALHFNFACAGMRSLPDDLDRPACRTIRTAFAAHRAWMLGVSATYNVIHPDRVRRDADTRRAQRVIALTPTLGTSLVSLCTGTRDPEYMWRGHPGNSEPAAWRDLIDSLAVLLEAAQDAGVMLGIEPERNNVVSSAPLALRLIDEMRTPHLKVILDPANLVDPTSPGTQRAVLSEAFDLLAPHTVMVHAKDVTPTGHVAAGRGLLDYQHVFGLVRAHRLSCPVVIHEVGIDDVGRARAFVEALAAPVRSELQGAMRDGAMP